MPVRAARSTRRSTRLELLGEASMVSMRVGGELVSIKTSKDFCGRDRRDDLGHRSRQSCHFFDRDTGARLAA